METQRIENWLKKPFGVFLFLALCGILLKIHYLIWTIMPSGDILFYLEGARTILEGGVLYKDLGDIKPPGVFFLYAFVLKITGLEYFGIGLKILAIVFQTLSAFIGFKIGLIVFQEYKKSFIAGLTFLLAISIKENFWDYNIFLLCLLPLLTMLYLLLKNKEKMNPWNIFLAGFFLGLSFFLATHTLIFALAIPIWIFYKTKNWFSTFYFSFLAFIGFIVVFFSFFLYFYTHDALLDWWWWNIEWASFYGSAYPIWLKIWKFFYGFFLLWEFYPFFFAIIWVIRYFLKHSHSIPKETIFIVFLFFGLSLFSRALLSKEVARYYLIFLPLIVVTFPFFWESLSQKIRVALMLFFTIAYGYAIFQNFKVSQYYQNYLENKKPVYEWIMQNTRKEDKIFVWDIGEFYYYKTQRKIATSFYAPQQHLDYPYLWNQHNNKNIDVPWNKFFSELERDKPLIIIDISGNFSSSKKKERSQLLQSYVDRFQEWVEKNYSAQNLLFSGNITIWLRNKKGG